MAAQLMATKAPPRRGLAPWMSLASSSLPVPLSAWMRMVARLSAARRARASGAGGAWVGGLRLLKQDPFYKVLADHGWPRLYDPVTGEFLSPDLASTGLYTGSGTTTAALVVNRSRWFMGSRRGVVLEQEIADALGVTERTVQRDWAKARLFLHQLLRDE